MEMLIQQICEQLQMISVTGMSDIQIVQTDKTTVWCHALRFGKYEEKFTGLLPPESPSTPLGNGMNGGQNFEKILQKTLDIFNKSISI